MLCCVKCCYWVPCFPSSVNAEWEVGYSIHIGKVLYQIIAIPPPPQLSVRLPIAFVSDLALSNLCP